MNSPTVSLGTQALLVAALLPGPLLAQGDELTGVPIAGELIDPSLHGPVIIEGIEAVLAREAEAPAWDGKIRRMRDAGDVGEWFLPKFHRRLTPHSGDKYAYNKWGDMEMSISFPTLTTLEGAFIGGHGSENAWAAGLTVVGYRGDVEVARTSVLKDIDRTPTWFAMDLAGIDRAVFLADARAGGGAWFSMDDLTFTSAAGRKVLDFEHDDYDASLTSQGPGYGGLTWRRGAGQFPTAGQVHAPQVPAGVTLPRASGSGGGFLGGGGTLPTLGTSFNGPWINDAGAGWIPPDTCGAVGPDHFVAVVNQHLSVYNKSGSRLLNTSLSSFFGLGGGSYGDPRIAYDEHDDRWVVLATDFSTRVRLAYSTSSDPMGSWAKVNVTVSAGVDASRWPDYPTLGVDEHGIYTCAYMVGGGGQMSIFAIDKAPLLSGSLGAVSAWRNLAWEGAIQPCVTHGTPGVEYLVSYNNSNRLRIRRVSPPLSSPTMTQVGFANISSWSSPPNAPQPGTSWDNDTLEGRLMNAVYRNGSVWTTHCINSSGRAAVRWYEVDVPSMSLAQQGTINDSSLHYYMPSISVNSSNDVALGFSGSSTSVTPGCYYTGRVSGDPSAQTAPPFRYRSSSNSYANSGSNGVNRWGDYSLTSVDPSDDTTIWTIQEYVRSGTGSWGTYVAELEFPAACPPPSSFCQTSTNSTGFGSVMGYQGSASISANDLFISAILAPSSQFGVFYYGPNQIQTAFGNGWRCVGGQTIRLPLLTTDAFGTGSLTLDLTNLPQGDTVSPGETINLQFWFRDPAAGGAAFNLSDGLSVTFCP